MYEVNGSEYSLEDLQEAAKQYNMDFDSYIEAMKKKGLVEKTPGSQTEDATASQVGTASKSEDGSLESQDEVYNAGLLPEVEIEAEGDDDITIRNPWGGGSFTISRKGWGSFFLGKPEDGETKQADAAALADEYMSVIHSTSAQDEDVQEAIANSYFNFDAKGSPRYKTERVYSIADKGYTLKKVINDDEQDYKDYFGESEKGKAKFEAWKKYNDTGELDLEAIPSSNIMSGKNSVKTKKAELFNERLSDEEREQYEYFLYGDQTVSDKKDEVDFKKTYGRPLVRVETIGGRTYLPAKKSMKARAEDEAKKQNKYALATSQSIVKDQDKYLQSKKDFDENPEVLSLRKRFEEIESELNKIGFVTKDSSPRLIDRYNSLIVEASEITKSFKESGFEKINLDLIKAAESIDSKTQDYYEKLELFNDTQLAKKAATLNYSNTERAALQLEKAFLGGGSVLASSIALGATDLADYLVDGYNKTKAVEEGVDRESLASVSETRIYEYLKNNKNASIDYYRALGGELKEEFSQNIDFSWENIGVWLPQALANNSPSIVAVGATMGTAGLITKTMHPLFRGATLAETAANKAIVTKAASKLAQASFFTIAGGQKAGDLEIAQQDAPLIISSLKQAYDAAETNDEKLLIAKQISEQKDALSMSELQKAFSYTVHGGIELFTEKLGSLNAIENFRRFSKITGGNVFARSGRLAADIGVSQAIELSEELAAQILQNAGEIIIEGKDKSLAEGINKDFFANTIVTGLAMQGGNIGSNLYNIVKSEVQTAEEISKSHELMEELLEIQNILQTGVGLSSKDRKLVLKRKKEIIKEAALADVTTVQKLNRLSPEEIELAFELARERRSKLKEIQELGSTGDVSEFMQKQKEKLFKEFKDIEQKRSDLLSKNEKAKLEKAKDLANPAKAVYAASLNDFYTDLAKYSVSRSKGEYVDTQGQNPIDMLELFTKKYGSQVAVELISEYMAGANAGYYNNDIIVFQDNIDAKIYSDQASDIETLIAAVSPMHEALHAKNKEAGIIKDGQLVGAAKIATEGIQALLQQKLDQGKITSEAFEAYVNRRDELYTTEDGVNAEEMINLVNDLVAIGALNPNDFSNLFGFKTFLNGLAKKLLGDESLFYPLETASDIFGYVKSFQKEFKGSELLLTGEDEDSDVALSKARKTVLEEINNLLPENINTKEDYNKFLDDPRSFMKLYEATQDDGVISNYVKSRTTNRAEFEEAIDSVIMRLRNFDPSKQRKEGGVVGREGFGEFVFANTNFGKLDAKKALAIKAEQAKETTSLDAEESFVQVADESAAFDEDVTPTKEKAKKPKINALRIGKVGNKEKQIVDAVEVKEGDTFKEVLVDNTGKVGQIIFDVPSVKLTDPAKNLTYAKKIVDGIPESSEAGNIQSFFSDAETVRNFIKILPKTNVSEDTGDINLLGENIDVSRDVLGLGLGTSNNVLKYFYNKTTKRSRGKKSQPFIWELKDEFTNPSKEQIEQFQEALGITPRGQLNNYDRNTGQLLKGVAKMMAGQASLSAAQRQLEAKGAPKQQVAEITAGQSKIAFSKSGKIIASDEMMKVMFSKSQGKRAAEAFGYDHLDLNKEEAKEEFIEWVKNVGSKAMPRSFWEASGNLVGGGAVNESIQNSKGEQLYIDSNGKRTTKKTKNKLKKYPLKSGGSIFNDNINFKSKEIQLELIPDGKMVFANVEQMNEAFKGVEFAPENKNIKDSTKRITLYGKKTGEQVRKLIDKKKDFLNNSDKGFIDTWMAIAKDIDKNPDNRRFWAAWLEVTPQNMSHFMRVGAKLSFYNTLDLKNVEEHTSPATDFAFALWAFANSRDKKGNQILTESLLKKSMESYIQGSLPKVFDNLLKGDGFDYIATIPKEYRLQVIAGEIPVWIRYINDKVNAQKYTLDGVEYSGINPNVIILANGKTLAQNYGLGVDKRLHFYQGAISTQQDLLFKVFKGEITEANAKKQLDKYVEGTKILKLDTKSKSKMSKTITNVRPVLAYSKASRGMSTFDFDETLIIDGENFVVATKDGETVKIPSDKWPIDGPRYAAEGYNFDFSDFVNVRGGKEGPLLQKMKNQIEKYGTSNVFVLTARMQDAAEPIHNWLKSKGINIPLENITGLGKSEGDAKAQWFVDKYAEGYNDMYFVDDALPNVEAVKHVFDQLDVKGKSVQARIQFSKGIASTLSKNKSYNKFKDSLTESVFYHGGLNSLKNKNAVWFIVDDVGGAELYADVRDVEDEVYSVKASQLKNSIIIPDINDSFGFDKIIKQKFSDQYETLVDSNGAVKIEKVLEVDNAAEIISEYMSWADNKFKLFEGVYGPEKGLYDNAGKIAKRLPVIVLNTDVSGKAKQVKPSAKFSKSSLRKNKSVQHIMDQLDIKGKSVQARIQFSKSLDPKFNQMLERTKGVGAEKVFSSVVAKKRGKNVGRFQFFVPPSADDFTGLLRYFVGKGEQGNADIEFFNEALVKPFARADREMSMLRQAILGDYKKLRKEYRDVKKKLGKMMPNSDFTLDNAIRVYLWNKAGFEIPGLSKRDTENLVARVEADVVTKAFADALGLISRQEKGYSKPGENWNTETIAYDLQNIATKVSRKKFMAEWIENKNEIFTPENLNKIEAIYGTDFKEALKDILYRMENGTNRSSNKSYGQSWTNWVNNSVGAIMFFNSRSAVLQTLSMVNFINFEDNNIFKAGKAFVNQKQYWSDFSTLFNSDFLKNRRAGLATNVNEAELANAVAGATNKAKAAIGYLLKIGFTPTQIADSFAIASGGSTFYRNRVNKYIKEGRDVKEAEEQAFLDFQEIAEETQQSARPDRISQQQASPLGRLILAFANTPMQYNRLIKKAAGDLINKRGDWRANVSRILYYGAIQNAIFASLQSAIFAIAFDDKEDEEEVLDKKSERILNSMLDSLLRGSGVAGAAVSTLKNTILEFMAQSEKGYKADYGEVLVEALNVSPPMGSKARKVYGALKTYKFNRDVMGEMDTFDYNNPIWDAAGNITSAAFNIPADRAIRKIDNLREAFNQENSALQRTFLALGWSAWDLEVGEEVIMNKGKSNEYVRLMPLKQKAQYEAEKQKDAREKKEKRAKQRRCSKIKSDGRRCKVMVDKPKTRCHYHD